MNKVKIIQKCIDMIEKQLNNKVVFENIAQKNGLSYFYFYRLFNKVTGFTPKQYLRKRRLSVAAKELYFCKLSIYKIAKSYQFLSQEAFTRAFKKEFNITPGKLRKTKHPFIYTFKLDLCKKVTGGFIMQPKIITIKPKKVVGMEVSTNMKENKIPQLWMDFMPRFSEIKTNKEVAFGVCYPLDCNLEDMTDEKEFTYLACAEVENFNEVPAGMKSYTIPEGKYAVFTHKGSLVGLGETYCNIYGKWLAENKLEISNTGNFELYDDRYHHEQEDSEMDIYIPVK